MSAFTCILGKGEVVSSILTGSTSKMGAFQRAPLQNRAGQTAKRRANAHHIRTICSRVSIERRTKSAPKGRLPQGPSRHRNSVSPVTYVTGICGPPELTVRLTEETSSDGGRQC